MIADESVNKNLINALRKAGHSVLAIAEENADISDGGDRNAVFVSSRHYYFRR